MNFHTKTALVLLLLTGFSVGCLAPEETVTVPNVSRTITPPTEPRYSVSVNDTGPVAHERVTLKLHADDQDLLLLATGLLDPEKDALDDEFVDVTGVIFDRQALTTLAIDTDYPISGRSSTPNRCTNLATASTVVFTAEGDHVAPVRSLFWQRQSLFNYCQDCLFSWTGTLRFSRIDTERIAGQLTLEGNADGVLPISVTIALDFDEQLPTEE